VLFENSSRITLRRSLAKQTGRCSVGQSVRKCLPIGVRSGQEFGKPFAVNED
jgi:hypothetical protein